MKTTLKEGPKFNQGLVNNPLMKGDLIIKFEEEQPPPPPPPPTRPPSPHPGTYEPPIPNKQIPDKDPIPSPPPRPDR